MNLTKSVISNDLEIQVMALKINRQIQKWASFKLNFTYVHHSFLYIPKCNENLWIKHKNGALDPFA